MQFGAKNVAFRPHSGSHQAAIRQRSGSDQHGTPPACRGRAVSATPICAHPPTDPRPQGGTRQAGHRRGPGSLHAAIRGRSRGHSIAAFRPPGPYPAQAGHPRPLSPAALGHPCSIPPCAGPSPPLFPPAQAHHPPARVPIPPYKQGGRASVKFTNVIKLNYNCN